MSEIIWADRFTGTRYVCGRAWLDWVSEELTAELSAILAKYSSLKGAADAVGCFWKHQYYERLFPLRFGRGEGDDGILERRLLWENIQAERIELDAYADRDKYRLREALLDWDALPPILPDQKKGEEGWLLVDRLLVEASLLNLLLAPESRVSADERHAARLAALTYPFYEQLADKSPLLRGDLVQAISQVLAGGDAKLPDPLSETVQAVHDLKFDSLNKQNIRLVMVAAQRIKQYVFDTSGLNEIRGASTLLEEITRELRQQVEQKIGPEVVLRAAGSTLVFLAPATKEQEHWPKTLRTTFSKQTGTAFTAAAYVDVPVEELVDEYALAIGTLYKKLDIDRYQARQASFISFPFETRCILCQTRAAEGWDAAPGELDLPQNRRPLCRVCKSKRVLGQSDRYDQVNKMLDILGHRWDPAPLGVRGLRQRDWMPDDLGSLIPEQARHSLLGVVYGDGNNFGAIAMKLEDIALGLQWTARVELTTYAATALALGQATQKGAVLRGWQPDGDEVLNKIPFQVLALGGDDISLFAWAPVALHFAAEFTHLTDLEFEGIEDSSLRLSSDPLTFSLGVLVTDKNTPVNKSVDFADGPLMKWAKKVAKDNKLNYGTIAMVYAPTAESVPSDLERYREELYLLGAGANLELCTTLRPYSAEELQMLLDVAGNLLKKGYLGRFQRLIGAFYGARQSAMVGLLHYAYQRSRAASEGWLAELEQSLIPPHLTPEEAPRALLVKYPVEQYPEGRQAFGLKAKGNEQSNGKSLWFSPLWDVFELAKLMS